MPSPPEEEGCGREVKHGGGREAKSPNQNCKQAKVTGKPKYHGKASCTAQAL